MINPELQGEDPEEVGERIREALEVTDYLQSRWKDADGRVAFNAWRNRIEALGVLVFQATRLASDEASGFAISHEQLPVIVVNRRDAPSRRTFSLLHEFAHLMLRVSGVSDLETDAARPPEDQRIEVFCNHVAAAALMPRQRILALTGTSGGEVSPREFSDTEISDLARSFGVSREALVRRLLTFGLVSDDFYGRKRAQYLAEFTAAQDRRRAAEKQDSVRRNMPQEALSNLGRPLVEMVLGTYYRDLITLSDVSDYLGIKTKHIPKLESVVR
jgi:Zn-dependent peptidase ImmA (M78 family)